MRRAITLAAALLLAACGNRQSLHPPAGASLPPKPATAPTAPTANELLKTRTADRPGRSDELMTKSQPRPDDPFDQPPK